MPESTDRPSSPPGRLARGLVRLTTGHPLLVLAGSLAVAVAGVVLASKLTLQTDLSELLPPTAESVIHLKALNRRVGGTGNVAIALEGPPAGLRAFVPRLVAALRQQLGRDLLLVKYQRRDVDDYFLRFAAYYAPIEDLRRWTEELAEAIAREANPALVDLDDEPPPPPAPTTPPGPSGPGAAPDAKEDSVRRLVREIREARQRLLPKNEADPETGLLMAEGGRLAVVFVRPAANSLHLAGSEGMLQRIKDVISTVHPEADGVHVSGFTGSIPSALAEVKAIERDIASTALLVIALVGLVVILYYRGLPGFPARPRALALRLLVLPLAVVVHYLRGGRELLLLAGPLIVGIAAAMGFAFLWIGHVNAQTAFLGAIIVGTGINYGIILLDRYNRLRSQAATATSQPQSQAELRALLERACDDSLRATWIASLATAVSFGVLAAGEVESFHQFGWIGGLGILACWVFTYLMLPSLLFLLDRRRAPRASARRAPLDAVFRGLGVVAHRVPWLVIAVVVGLSGWMAVEAWQARHDLVESDMRRLGTRSSRTKGIEKLDNRLRKMDDRSSTPAVIATDNREDPGEVCKVLRERARTDLKDILVRCYSLDDLLPRDLEERRRLMARLRADLDKLPTDGLAAEDRQEFDRLMAALVERPPTDADMPATLKEYYIERDGSIGKLAFVDPRNDHIEANLYKFSDAIREIRLASGKVVISSGENVVFADVLRAMRRDARRLTAASAILVLVVLALATRRAGTFLRVGLTLVLGVILMCGWAVLQGERLNFFNFVALPTTFGIGIDYAINVEERLRRRAPRGGSPEMVQALAEVGGAVMLAALTSIFGYASLITADSQVLASFGRLAVLGEITCVLAAVTLVPALWALRRPRAS